MGTVVVKKSGEAKQEEAAGPVVDAKARRAAIDAAFANITKKFGDGAAMKLGDKPLERIPVIPSGCLSLDMALGVGGIPKGRIVEIFGPEMSGKTTLCLHLAASVQKDGGNVAIIDAEHGLDLKYARNLGVDVQNLWLSQPEYGEQALEIAEEWIKSGAMDLVVVDSVAALVPRAEIEGEMGDPTMGVQARLMSQAMRKLVGAVSKTNTTLVFTNQLRMKIGVMFGNPETTTGGNALKFYASVRLDVRRIETLKSEDGKSIVGNKTRIKVVKNKVAPPFTETVVDVLYGSGFDVYGDLVSLAESLGVVQKAGSWYSYKGAKLGQGAKAVVSYLKDSQAIYQEVLAEVKDKMAK